MPNRSATPEIRRDCTAGGCADSRGDLPLRPACREHHAKGDYAGVLPVTDPLFALLSARVLTAVNANDAPVPIFDVYRLDAVGVVFLYHERRTGVRLVAKFYGNKPVSGTGQDSPALRGRFLRQEFSSLERLRALGFAKPPIRVVRPLGMEEGVNHVLLLEYVAGNDLQSAVAATAAEERDGGQLRQELRLVAQFLARLHARTRSAIPLDAREALAFLDKMIGTHAAQGLISACRRRRADQARGSWAASGALSSDRQVLIHGDATPPHFLFSPEEGHLTVVDLERVWPGDPAKDLGSLAAELKCAFWQETGDPWASEPFIRHLYAEYLREAAIDPAPFTRRAAFHQGCYQMRIARNAWVGPEMKERLIEDGLRCLAAEETGR